MSRSLCEQNKIFKEKIMVVMNIFSNTYFIPLFHATVFTILASIFGIRNDSAAARQPVLIKLIMRVNYQ